MNLWRSLVAGAWVVVCPFAFSSQTGPSALAAPVSAAQPSRADTKVWVNTSSKVYHCPGTRYYGKTARGVFMTETEARQQHFRPAYGRSCGGAAGTTDAVPTATVGATPPSPKANAAAMTGSADGNPNAQVWVNTSTRVYHCPGTRYYGATKTGVYMKQAAAQAAGHRPASGKICG